MSSEITARAGSVRSPRADGLRLPARFVEHTRTLLSWPCREDAFGPLMRQACEEWAEVARAVARFEPVTVIARPEALAEVTSLCGPEVDVLSLPLDDSWIRDNGPIFVVDQAGAVAIVGFGFDGWNHQFTPFDIGGGGLGCITRRCPPDHSCR